MKLLIFVTLWSGSLFAGNAKDVWKFTPADCQEYLKTEIQPNSVNDAKVEHLVGWMTASHPALRRIFESSLPLSAKYDLFFLTTGYLLPPPSIKGFGVNRAVTHFDRPLRFWHRHWVIDTKARARRTLRAIMTQVTGTSGASPPALQLPFLTELVSRSLFALHMLTAPSSQIGMSHDGLRAINFDTQTENYWFDEALHGGWSIDWPMCVHRGDLDRLAEVLRFLEDDDVRARIVHRTARGMGELVRTQQELCGRLNASATSEDFTRIMAEHGRSSLDDIPRLVEELETVKLADHVDPPMFLAQALKDFLTDDVRYVPTTLEKAPLDEIWKDIQRVTDYAAEALFELQPWWADRADWRQFLAKLEASIASVDALRKEISVRRKQIRLALEGFTRGEDAFAELDAWNARTNAYVASLGATEARVSALPNDRRQRYAAILAGAPLLTQLVGTSRVAIAQRRRIMNEQLEAIQKVIVLIGLVARSRVTEPSANGDVRTAPSYLKLREALEHLAGES